MRLKKIPYYLSVTLLTTGASLILGFLSFGGMFALWPILPVAFAAFVLSVAYEGEIYLQNIKGALNKLFKYNFLQRDLAKSYLLENFPDTTMKDCPQFFKDYEAQLQLLSQFGHHRLDKESAAEKKRIEKTLGDMEKWFALQLFSSDMDKTDYEIELREWLGEHEQETWQTEFTNLNSKLQKVKIFSTLSGLFMGLGTTYLLVEAFSVIPFFAAIPFASWPLMIAPMAIIAGAAYGLLTFNAVTDMIRNDTIRKWYRRISDDLSNDWGLRSVLMAVSATLLLGLAAALTICTAGTWWTVVKEARPLFAWMGNMPRFIMGVINPVITGFSAVIFNLQNTSESLELIDEASRSNTSFFSRMWTSMQNGFRWVQNNENWLQIINPFRLLLKLTITPLRLLMFLGHLISIGVTSDRVPGVSQRLSALLGIICEGFEDATYFDFIGNSPETDSDNDEPVTTEKLLQARLAKKDDHSHTTDLPTRFIKLVFSPVYFLAATWDFLASQRNSGSKVLSFTQAWEKQVGESEPERHIKRDLQIAQPSSAWKIQQALFRIERHKEKQLDGVWVGQDIAQQKKAQLTRLQDDIAKLDPANNAALPARLVTETRQVYNQHCWFNQGPTATETFLQELPQRVNCPG